MGAFDDARVHRGPAGGALYVLNPTREPQKVEIALGPDYTELKVAGAYWGEATGASFTVPLRDIVIAKLV